MLHLTAAGKRIAAKASPIVGQLQQTLTAGFTEDEVAVIARFVEAAIGRELVS